MKTRSLWLAAIVLLAGGCDDIDSGIVDGGDPATLELTVNADGTMTQEDNGVGAAIESGSPIRVLARGVDGEVLYDVTGANTAELLRAFPAAPVSRGEIAAAFADASPEVLTAVADMRNAIPSLEEMRAMSPTERAEARAAFEDARARALRGVK